MKYFVTLFIILSAVYVSSAQTYEIGAFVGGSNFVGDVGKTNYIAPNELALGGVFKWNRSSRHAFRFSAMFASISGDDNESSEARRQERGYNFENTITEVSLGVEYTFFDYNVYSGRPVSTPYLYTGLTYFGYNALFKRSSDIIDDYDSAGSVAIPMVLGYKANLGGKIVLAFEIGARYTFTDGLDGSFPVGGLEDDETLRFGNRNNNDWYVFSGVTIGFTFGRKPCYCNF